MLVACATLAAVALPVRRDGRLHDRAPAGVPRGRPRARARDAGRRGAAALAGLPAVPALRPPRSRRDFLRCPHCLRKLQRHLRELREAAGSRLEDLPVLRGRDPRGHAAAPLAAALARGGRRFDADEATGYEDTEIGEATTPGRSRRSRPGTVTAAGRVRRGARERSAAVHAALRPTRPNTEIPWTGPSSWSSPTPSRANLTGEIIARFERKGLRLVALKLDDHQPRARGGALRRARRARRSSASSSSSSPAARSSRWCSRATRPSSPPAR